MRINMRVAAAAAVAVAVATLVPGTAWANEGATGEAEATATLGATKFANDTYGFGAVSGKAELEEEDGRLEIEAEVQGLKPGTTHIGHIHLGDCKALTPGDIIHNLTPVMIGQDGEGRSVTVIDDTTGASLADVENCDWWVAFHEGPENRSPQSPAVAVGPVLLKQE